MKKELRRDILKMLAFSVLVTVGFFVYYYFIGIPKTQARNYYNLAEKYLGLNDKQIARRYLFQGLQIWPEDYIKQKINELN